MASFSFSTLPITTTTTSTTKKPLFSKRSSHVKHSHRFKFSCKAAADNNDKPVENSDTPKLILPISPSFDMQNVDRRNLLLGLGGLYSAANLTAIPSAFGIPIAAPDDIGTCVAAKSSVVNTKEAIRGLACCPPKRSNDKPVAYKFPTDQVIRVRPAAQKATKVYIEKFQEAVKIMKAYEDDHPHSWTQQAKIHCAYCNGGYRQIQSGFPELEIQVHNSWLFFPFHRWYLYFLEKIMGKVLKDSSFALPYWNWDNPTGMAIPDMYEDGLRANPLFDPLRNASHLPPALIDFQYDPKKDDKTCVNQISINLSTMYSQMVTSAPDTASFFGGEFVAGKDPLEKPRVIKGGSIENGVHTMAHRWVGNNRLKNSEDMGNFYSAGYDPLFYGHHANVDRMWSIWKAMDRKGHKDPTSPDWRDASYVFYDEELRLVRVYNRDCVDTRKMGYVYERSDIPWIRSRPTPHAKGANVVAKAAAAGVLKLEDLKLPVKLDKTLEVIVKRPAKNRTNEDKEKANELLMLNDIHFNCERFVNFNVIVNDADDGVEVTAVDSEFAGNFAQLPHGDSDNKMEMTSGASFGIGEILEDVEAEGDDSILVKIVPKEGCDDVTISEIKVVLVTPE